ncbi:MAG: hypothetical protein BSOLF_2372 [Candidatus Carbobacillus altaicus]|uniref:Uncharacterized protein n=1 Tax=Candidatus Carbonibacillus altaicus TaxID=2163959 RepID=A0A2R6Y2Q5_9BACL|nr:MAG: hypothetical protein BSOLF_2372 [Candidatus Carbobacillus altaicus]
MALDDFTFIANLFDRWANFHPERLLSSTDDPSQKALHIQRAVRLRRPLMDEILS